MRIADDNGEIYLVEQPEAFLEALDNDELIAVMKTTFIAKTLNNDLLNMIEMGLIERVEGNGDEESLAEELNAGVEFIKTHLEKELAKEVIEDALTEARVSMYGNRHTNGEEK